MSILQYGSISLPYANCTQFLQEVVYDESNTDWFCTRYALTVQCLINTNYLSQIAPGLIVGGVVQTRNPADVIVYMRRHLMTPRNRLSFTFNGVELIPQAQAYNDLAVPLPGTVDAMNGPRPQRFNYSLLTNTTFMIDYSIVAHYWENAQPVGGSTTQPLPQFNKTGSAVLYNRWSENVEIDNCLRTTRTREGKFVIRSDNADGFVADFYRNQFAIVGVPRKFLRKSSSYTISPDGLGITYRITDEEQFKMPPNPAYVAEGDFTESAPEGWGPVRYGDLRLLLKGANTTDQATLINTALSLAEQKYAKIATKALPNFGAVPTFSGFATMFSTAVTSIPISATIRVDSYNNAVELRVRRQYWADQFLSPGGFAAFAGQALSYTPGSEPDPATYSGQTTAQINAAIDLYVSGLVKNYPTGGTANRMLQAAAYFDPSLKTEQLAIDPQNSQTGSGVNMIIPGQAGFYPERS